MSRYLEKMNELSFLLTNVEATDQKNLTLHIDKAFNQLLAETRKIQAQRKRIFLIGNGASATIANHVAADLGKNGHLLTEVFANCALLTAVVNDIGAEYLFSEPLKRQSEQGDMLVAISSSGTSENIINAVKTALQNKLKVITFSAFKKNNVLRNSGHLNFYVKAKTYGQAETCHAALLHYWIDLVAGALPVLNVKTKEKNPLSDNKQKFF
jgi:D-sedoheptulose 7-phosphate isomerase